MYAEALRQDWPKSSTFVDAAKDVQKSVSNETVLVVVTYFDAAGVELASSPSPLRTEPGIYRGAAQVQLLFRFPKGLTAVSSPLLFS